MLSNSERHFMEHWAEQKSGPRWKYYLQFTIAWTVVSFLVIFFLTKLFTTAWETGGNNLIIFLIIASILCGWFATHFTYTRSERRYRLILKREEGKKKVEGN
jgi:cation transporter-like permease